MTTWSRQSRRSIPISRSAYGFCHGDRGDMGRSRIPIARTRRRKTGPYDAVIVAHQVGSVLSPTERSRQSAAPATRRSDAWLPQTTAVTGARSARLEQRTGPWPRCAAHGYAETCPTLPARIAFPGHILGDGRLSYLEAELEQLTMDPRRTPKNVLNAHAPDQRSQTRIDLRPPPAERVFQRQ